MPEHICKIYSWLLKNEWTIDYTLEYFESISQWPGQTFFAHHKEALTLLRKYKNDKT